MLGSKYFVLIILCFSIFTTAVCAGTDDNYKILILHSYSTDYQWTNETNNAIHTALLELAPHAIVRTEFMDTKNFFNEEYLLSLAVLYKQKYANFQPDGIILTDNNAMDFIERFGTELFPEAVIVACGINNAQLPEPGSPILSIIPEEADHLETFRQGLKLWPETKTIFVIRDASRTGELLSKEIEYAAAGFEQNVDIVFINDLNIDELKVFVSSCTESDLIYILPFFRTVNEGVFTQGQVESILAEASSVPVMASWSFQLGRGVLGGRVILSEQHGKIAVETLLNIFENKTVTKFNRVSINEAQHVNVYDYDAVKKYGINNNLLPENIHWLNKPQPLFQKYSEIIFPIMFTLFAMLLFIILLYLNLKKQKTINKYNIEVLALNREIIDTQQEIVNTLGEVIEARSQETGNHVMSVCKLSRYLGEKMGLNSHELDILEASASLHDVGKIGIPETILHKPGKLDQEEFALIKTHTNIGKDILKGSNRELLKTAREIAFQHHERWDGTGYPDGLKNNEISINARITMIADIYDALAGERSYKKEWSEEKILEYITSEKGKAFEPRLVDIFVENISSLREIRERYAPKK